MSFVLGAAVAVIVALVLRGRADRRWRTTLEEREHEDELERRALSDAAERADRDFRAQKDRLQREADARVAQLQAEHDLAFQERQTLVDHIMDSARRALETELVSREAILRASATLGVNGVLATRTFILGQQGLSTARRVVQLDHVLLTDAGALLVHNKTWDGVIFDGVRPSEAQPAFANLVDDANLRPPFAVQISPGRDARSPSDDTPSTAGLRVVTHVGDHSPRRAALEHAEQLAHFAEAALGEGITVDTCVFYSNLAATVHTDAAGVTPSADRTAVVADESQFLDLLARRERARRRPLTPAQIERLTMLLHGQGAKIDAFGDYERLAPSEQPHEGH
ncbi:hypothetical protein C5B97_05465 [Pseudoclavibacter sp. RFBB5]|nr:hypothetical protein C5B97_05465 [Pseudoclavibacter sp. RFBB5]